MIPTQTSPVKPLKKYQIGLLSHEIVRNPPLFLSQRNKQNQKQKFNSGKLKNRDPNFWYSATAYLEHSSDQRLDSSQILNSQILRKTSKNPRLKACVFLEVLVFGHPKLKLFFFLWTICCYDVFSPNSSCDVSFAKEVECKQ